MNPALNPTECYRLLGLPDGAPQAAIKLAYRRRARLLHPDTNQQDAAAHEKFIQITAAYKILLQYVPKTVAKPQLTPEQQLKINAHKQLQQLLKTQRLPRAIAFVEAIAQKLPNDSEVRQWQGLIYQRWGRQLVYNYAFAQAEAYLLKALRTDPHNQSLIADVEQDLRQIRRLNRLPG
jgi:tetratricopeptide (TPR) repeat protein